MRYEACKLSTNDTVPGLVICVCQSRPQQLSCFLDQQNENLPKATSNDSPSNKANPAFWIVNSSISESIKDDFTTAFDAIGVRKRIFAISCCMKSSSDMSIDDFLEDSLTYSPLKEIQNKENSPALFLKNLERAKHSPSTAKLFALLGGGNGRSESFLGSPASSKLVARKLEDLLNTPERSPDEASDTKIMSENSSEVVSLRASLAHIQKDCDFHRKRAMDAQDELDHLSKYVSLLEEERRKSLGSDASKLTSLNKSLARQNDLLRSRSSVTSRFSKKDCGTQTIPERSASIGTDTVGLVCIGQHSPIGLMSPDVVGQLSFMGTPFSAETVTGRQQFKEWLRRDSETQTSTGVWVTVEDLPRIAERPSLPIPKRTSSSHRQEKYNIPQSLSPSKRKSAPQKSRQSSRPDSYLFLSRNDWRPLGTAKLRGKSVGTGRPRWIP